MDLKTYLASLPEPEREPFAKKCGTTLGHLRNVMYGYKPCAPEYAVAIERLSGGVVTREKLRPSDYWLYWPDLSEPKRSKASKATT
jgi:DNA-binding transcriptional regulator YdaS (Cro superfamily)